MITKDLPLASHRYARQAAEAARCAGAEGRYWSYHDRLFAEQPRFAEERLIEYAVGVGLEREAFGRCLAERRFARAVDADLAQARALGIASTPVPGKRTSDNGPLCRLRSGDREGCETSLRP